VWRGREIAYPPGIAARLARRHGCRVDDMFQQAHVKRVAVACTLLKAEVVEYPGGMPGDIGFFLTWK
jgi:hypothetical protein